MNECLGRGRILRERSLGQPEDRGQARAGIGVARMALPIELVFVNQSRYFVSQSGQQVGTLAQLFRQGDCIADVGGHTSHAQRLAISVAADDLAAA